MRFLPCLVLLSATLGGCAFLDSAPRPETSPDVAQSSTTTVATGSATTTYMYVFNGLGETIDEINLKTREVKMGILATGQVPNQFMTEGAVTYLVNSKDATLYKLDLRARKKLDTMNLTNGSNPMSLTLLGSNKGFVTNLLTDYVSWVDLATKTQEATESIRGAAGGGVAIIGDRAYVPAVESTHDANWVFTYSFSGIHVYDLATRTLVKTISLAPDGLANYFGMADISTDPQGRVVVTANEGLAVIDPATDAVLRTINFGVPAHSVQYVSATKAYAAADGGMVSFNPETGAILRGRSDKIASGGGNFKIFGQAAYVANFALDSVRVIDLATEQASGSDLLVGDGPQDLTFITVAE